MKHPILTACLLCLSLYGQAQKFSTTLQTERKPWTAEPKIASDNYKFIVLPDKTGGPEIGVFEQAIKEINALAPDFVINVGDLIGGYYTDVKYCERDWGLMMERLKAFEVPFFFVGGNHDLTNQLQTDYFCKLFGTTYYSFSIGPDLFLVLDSEEHNGRSVSPQQVEYFRGILNGWTGRHIYVFMHSPLWAPESHGGYEEIAALLKGHQYTVFSGHTHQYYYENREGMDHFVLATAGGDSERRGPLMGEYDHLMLVSAKEGKPSIVNLPIGSILPNDIVDKSTMPKIAWMTSRKYVKCPYILLDEAAPEEFEIELTISNPMDEKMTYSVLFPNDMGLQFSPDKMNEELGPKAEKKQKVTVRNPEKREPGKITLKTTCAYDLKGELKTAEGKTDILTDHIRTLSKGQKLHLECIDPYHVSESWDWHGKEDGWFEFDVQNTGKDLLVSVVTHDDLRVLDKVTIFIESGGEKYAFDYEPEKAVMKFPLKKIKDNSFLLNVCFTDNDDPEEGDPSVLWWRLPSQPGQFRILK